MIKKAFLYVSSNLDVFEKRKILFIIVLLTQSLLDLKRIFSFREFRDNMLQGLTNPLKKKKI